MHEHLPPVTWLDSRLPRVKWADAIWETTFSARSRYACVGIAAGLARPDEAQIWAIRLCPRPLVRPIEGLPITASLVQDPLLPLADKLNSVLINRWLAGVMVELGQGRLSKRERQRRAR